MAKVRKNAVIKWIKSADITKDDWYEDIYQYLKGAEIGYVEAKIDQLLNSIYSDSESFREELIDIIKYLVKD